MPYLFICIDMKLLLNLTLRRALMAAMAMCALPAIKAAITTGNGHLYVRGPVSLTSGEWSGVWRGVSGALSVGTSEGAGVLLLESGRYATPGAAFIAGKGLDTHGSVPNDGEIEVKSAAVLDVATCLYVGASHFGGTGTLTLSGGRVNVGSEMYVGAYMGRGVIQATDGAELTVDSGPRGALFVMGYHDHFAKDDTATFTDSYIMVGTRGGIKDYITIGQGLGKSVLTLDNSKAAFADQILVGECAGSDGSIYVRDRSRMNLNGFTMLGLNAGAKGAVYIEDGRVNAEEIAIGAAGKGTVELADEDAILDAHSIHLGLEEGAEGALIVRKGSVIAEDAITAGDAGTGVIMNSGSITARNIVLGSAASGQGVLENSGSVELGQSLIVGSGGAATATVTGGSLKAANAHISGAGNKLLTTGGETTLTHAMVLEGSIGTSGGAVTRVTGELILADNGYAMTAGTMDVGSALIQSGSFIRSEAGGHLTTTGQVFNEGLVCIDRGGRWNADGRAFSLSGRIENDGDMTVGGTLFTGQVEGEGTALVEKVGTWDIRAGVTQHSITNEGDITIHGGGRMTASALKGNDGIASIVVDGSFVSTQQGEAVITLDYQPASRVEVVIDPENGSELVGKRADFVMAGGTLQHLSDACFHVGEGWTLDWAECRISSASENRSAQIDFVGNQSWMHFIKSRVQETTETGGETPGVRIELEVVTETALSQNVTLAEAGECLLPAESDCVIDESAPIHRADLILGLDEQGGEARAKVIVGQNVASAGTPDATKIQTVVINQTTTIGERVIRETLGTNGVVLVLAGDGEHRGRGKEVSELGFAESTRTGKVVTECRGTALTNEMKKVDLVQIQDNADVSLSHLSMHSTHALTMEAGARLTLDSVGLHVGGTEGIQLTKEVDVVLYDEQGNVTGTRKETVETENLLSADSIISGADIALTNGSEMVFEMMESAAGSVIVDQSVVELSGGSALGNGSEDMQTIVFANGSQLKGSGSVSHICMRENTSLTVGNSPGVLQVSDAAFDAAEVRFCMVTNSPHWSESGNTTRADEESGAVSQLYIDRAVTMNNARVSIYYMKKEGGAYVPAYSDEMAVNFEEGASVTLITGNTDELSGSYMVDESTLPGLEPGLFWDTGRLFSTGRLFVMGEVLEDPARIANTMVSAGDTVLNFSRLMQVQAALRPAGTTRTWASAIAGFDRVDGSHSTTGFDYSNWGAALGADYALSENTVLGMAFGCTRGENKPAKGNDFYHAGRIDQDATMLGIYGVHRFRSAGFLSGGVLHASAVWGRFEHDSHRTAYRSGTGASARWDSEAWCIRAALSRDIAGPVGMVFTPHAGLEYTRGGMDSFTERGVRYNARYSACRDYSNLALRAGVDVSKTFGALTPYAGIAYIGDAVRDAAEVTAAGRCRIDAGSALPGRSALQLRMGATWQFNEGVDVHAGYSAELRDKATEHHARIGIGMTF